MKKSYCCNGQMLRYFRTRKSLTQNQLAKISGYSERLISKAESGKSVSASTIEDLAEALSTTEDVVRLQDLVCDPISLAREYVYCLYTYKKDVVNRISRFLSEDCVFRINGEEDGVPFAGVHEGIDEVRRAFEIFFSVLEVPTGHDYRPHYKFFGNGNEVIIWGETWIHPIGKPSDQPMQITIRMQFASGQLIEFDDRFDAKRGRELLEIA